MKVEFMVEDNAYYNSDMEYEIVESYYPDEYPQRGYDVYRVETESLSDIHIVNETTGIEYEAEQAVKCKDGNEDVYFVSIWNPIK